MIVLKNIQVAYPLDTVLEGVDLKISPTERIALIGENGSGKSTLIKIAAGLFEPTSGRVDRQYDMVIGYLPQSGLSYSGRTLWEEMLTALPEWLEKKKERKALLDKIATLNAEDREHQKAIDRYGELETQYQQEDGYAQESKLKRILAGLGFLPEDHERLVETFSAGWQMRVGLAKVLVREPDLMFLDEPTDHLDLDAKNWLEDYLNGIKTGFVLVSHDRHFLDVLAEKVLEICNKRLEVYIGNYSNYLKEKRVRFEAQRSAFLNQKARIEHVEKFVVRNRARKDRARQVQSRLRQLDKMTPLEEPLIRETSIQFHIPAPSRAPKKLLELIGVEKAFSGKVIFRGLGLVIERSERIAVVGPNGAGKSTLLGILSGQEKIQKGMRLVEEGVSIGTFSQDTGLSQQKNSSVLDTLLDIAPQLTQEKARGLLARFRFCGEDVFKPVKALSGGERVRLALAGILPKGCHMLLLDEPTNHLDIVSRQALLEALQAYGGTLVFVSHDRYFIQEIASRILEIQGDQVKSFNGTYEEYLSAKEGATQRLISISQNRSEGDGQQQLAPGDEKKQRIQEREEKKVEQRRAQRRRKRILQLEAEIADQERHLENLEVKMVSPEMARDYPKLQQLHEEAAAIKKDIEFKYSEWEKLSQEELDSAP